MDGTGRWGALVLALLVAPVVAAQDSVVGRWGPLLSWPEPAVHTHLLPTGKVMFVPEFDEGDTARTWDPVTGEIKVLPRPGHNIFCAGHSYLADGRMLVSGGHIDSDVGLRNAVLYDPFGNRWTDVPDMNAARWYPSNTTLSTGEVLVIAGNIDHHAGGNTLPQVYQPGSNTWRDLTSARRELPYYPWTFAAPDGRVFYAGYRSECLWLDPRGTGAWSPGPTKRYGSRSYGTAVMYDEGRVLIVGGSDPPKATAEVINLLASSPAWAATGAMSKARRQLNATVLPDGKVLVTGGSSGSGFDNASRPVRAAELWDPATGRWTVMASESRYRGYHSTAVLLPDGRVLSAGGRDERTAQVYSPPYLFKGARPSITTAPASVEYGASFTVGTPAVSAISRVTLVRLSSVTHSYNMEQRFLPLPFTPVSDGVRVTAPADPRRVPPGYYLLFLLDGRGVPSVGHILRVGGDAPPPPPPPPPGQLRAIAFGDTWRYDDRGVDNGTGWTAPAYGESGWKTGPAQLGYGDGDEATALLRLTPRQPSYYFRKKVRLDKPVTEAQLRVLFDDGVGVWVNGTLLFQRNLGNGTAYGAWASGTSGDNAVVTAPLPLSPNPFVVGDNVVAVMVKQAGATSSDVSFDLELLLWLAP
ncbi:galactose oxidase-like domain-containing protein [Pyxidicoccus sp. 3LG]